MERRRQSNRLSLCESSLPLATDKALATIGVDVTKVLVLSERDDESGDGGTGGSSNVPVAVAGFRAGEEAILHGLVKAPIYNGLRCTIVGPYMDSRYPVHLRNEGGVKNMRVRIENLAPADSLLAA